jgi:two-component system sensor histidine kinase KdpD
MESDKNKYMNILICLSGSPSNLRVIKAAAKLFERGSGSLTALYVSSADEDIASNTLLQKNIACAESLGAEVHYAQSNEIALTISEYAKHTAVTDLFIGYSPSSDLFPRRNIAEKLVELLPDVDIHIIPDASASAYSPVYKKSGESFWNLRDLLLVTGIMAAATLLSYLFDRSRFSNSNIVTIYILAVLIASVLTSHRFYGFLAAVLYILLFNFLFIEPRFTLLVYDSAYLMTYFVTIIASLITGSLAVKLKNVAKQSAETAYQTKVLLDTSDQLEAARDSSEMIRITCSQLANLLERTVSFYTVNDGCAERKTRAVWNRETPEEEQFTEAEKNAVLSVYSSMPDGKTAEGGQIYFPVASDETRFGVLSVRIGKEPLSEMENTILLSVINEFTMALNNEKIRQEKTEAEISAGKERFRAGLLRSISHDLRTPLTSIYGNAENLRENHAYMTEEDRQKIYEDIQEDSLWLKNQMENILSMTKLESHPYPSLSVESVEDVVNESLQHIDARAGGHKIRVIGSDDLLFAEMDPKLITQVLVNLLNNAVKYTPDGSEIIIRLQKEDGEIAVSVEDNGPGIPDENKAHIFDLYYTGSAGKSDSYRSMGIGLHLCRMILHAHGREIEVLDNQPHGAIFRFTLKSKEVEEYA